MSKKILISLSVIGAVAAIVVGGTIAYFSDTETSTGNIFTAGSIDLRVDSECSYNGEPGDCAGNWGINEDLDLTSEKFFDFDDVKPGDWGEDTISLHVYNNDAWLCAYVQNLENNDNGLTEPESAVDSTDGIGNGELQDYIYVTIWKDPDCNNELDNDEVPLVKDEPINSNAGGWPLFAPGVDQGNALPGDSDTCLGISWNIPADTGNIIQSDSVTADITFYVEQARNNEGFVCPNVPITKTVNLENKNDSWQVIADEIYGVMTYSSNDTTFHGSVVAQGLTENAKYQITLNGPGTCTQTDDNLADSGDNLFQSGYWNNWAPGLSPTCSGNPGEGIYNMNLVEDWYTVIADGSGNINYAFDLSLPVGSYSGVKVLVKKMLDTHTSPWVDDSATHVNNLFEVAPISFTIVP